MTLEDVLRAQAYLLFYCKEEGGTEGDRSVDTERGPLGERGEGRGDRGEEAVSPRGWQEILVDPNGSFPVTSCRGHNIFEVNGCTFDSSKLLSPLPSAAV